MVSLDLKQPILHLNEQICSHFSLLKWRGATVSLWYSLPPLLLQLTIYCNHFFILKSPKRLYHNLYRSPIPYPQIQNALKTFENLVPTHLMTNDQKWPIAIYGLFIPISVAISKFHGRNLDVLMMLLQTLLRMLNSICTKLFFENSKILKHIGSRSCGCV